MSSFNPHRHHRRSIRLRGYDYSEPGAYFLTICTHGREALLGTVVDGGVRLSAYGGIALRCWEELPSHYPHVGLDAFVVMPNHIHAVVVLDGDAHADDVEAGFKPSPTGRHGLGEIVRAFKTFSARRVNAARGTPGARVWQRNYYERIVRDEPELDRIREYIFNNPANWESDEYYAV